MLISRMLPHTYLTRSVGVEYVEVLEGRICADPAGQPIGLEIKSALRDAHRPLVLRKSGLCY